MNSPVTPKPPQPGSTATEILRIVLRIVNAVSLPFALLFASAMRAMRPVAVIPTLAAIASIGYFGRHLSLRQKRINQLNRHFRHPATHHGTSPRIRRQLRDLESQLQRFAPGQ